MRKAKDLHLTAKELRKRFDYDPLSGDLRRKLAVPGTKAGKLIVLKPRGKGLHTKIGIDNHIYSLDRILWLYVTGRWPDERLTFLDGDPNNHRFANIGPYQKPLEDLERFRPGWHLMGASFKNDRKDKPWQAVVNGQHTPDGKMMFLGRFKTELEAHRAYVTARKKLAENKLHR